MHTLYSPQPRREKPELRRARVFLWSRYPANRGRNEFCGAASTPFLRIRRGTACRARCSSGVAFYRAKGNAALENLQVPLINGEMLPIVRMAKEIKRDF